jgi:hypothetical protein
MNEYKTWQDFESKEESESEESESEESESEESETEESDEPEYSAWLWQYDGPMSMFDGTREECEKHIEGVYERFEKYYQEQVKKYRGKPHHPDCIPRPPQMELRRYMNPLEMRRFYKGY